ncbi:MAG TPA: menaquinone biosynthesis protein [Pirellulales bacterium]|jgi:chorismate dehydratase|nr:menaquinone biosynthesis protein [Pirellulales bacterium]
MATRLKVGAVNYLNTKPLVYRLQQFAPQVELSFDLPSRLADHLAAGQLDVALIPSIEYFQDPAYSIVSDACIACRGPVLSVKLFCRTPVSEIRTLALDEGSRTSAALIRILLKERFQLEPVCRPLPIGAAWDEANTDAVLLIGDRAIHSPPGRFAEVWDVGDQWCRWVGLPFVFAMWVARQGVSVRELEPALAEARDCGVTNLEQIAEAEAAPLGLTIPQCLAYLRDHLHFYLGPDEIHGLQLFYRKANELGLAPAGIQFAGMSISI